MKFQWRDGFRAPKGVTPEELKAALDILPEPSPEAILEASKNNQHILHSALWSEGDQVWAHRGRLDYCRHLLANLQEEIIVGGKTITIRAVEFIRDKDNGNGQWVDIDKIRSDPEMLDAYAAEVGRLMDQARAKNEKLRQLLKGN